jgi:hypothetical protein
VNSHYSKRRGEEVSMRELFENFDKNVIFGNFTKIYGQILFTAKIMK